MRTATDVKTDLYRDLYFNERNRREQIRGSIGTPTAALAFAAFNFSILADEVQPGLWPHPVTVVVILLMLAALAASVLSALNIIGVEWVFVYHEPPDLETLSEAEARLRRDCRGEASDHHPREPDEAWIGAELDKMTAASFYLAYSRYLAGNGKSARRRTWAQRFVVLALVCLIAAYVLLPFQGAPASPADLLKS